MIVQKMSKEQYRYVVSGVSDIHWQDTFLAQQAKPRFEIVKHKFLFWKWKTENVDRNAWINSCIRMIMDHGDPDYVYRILTYNEKEYDGDPCNLDYCIWQDGSPRGYYIPLRERKSL